MLEEKSRHPNTFTMNSRQYSRADESVARPQAAVRAYVKPQGVAKDFLK